jgi:hypothetical protein
VTFVIRQVTAIDHEPSELAIAKGVTDGDFSAWKGRRGGRIRLSIDARRTTLVRRGDDVTLVVTMAVQATSIHRDLHINSGTGRVTDGDLARRHGRPRHRCGYDYSTRAPCRWCWNDVAVMVTMAVQATSINGDFDIETRRCRVTNRDLASIDSRSC